MLVNSSRLRWASRRSIGTTVVKRQFGVAKRPDAFRPVAATPIAETDPEHVNIIKDILGHATLAMAEKHYNRATGISSYNGLRSIVEDIRKNVPMSYSPSIGQFRR